MQEHPDQYTEEQIESMIDILDQEPDVEAEWKRFDSTHQQQTVDRRYTLFHLSRSAAAVLLLMVTAGLLYAASVGLGLLSNPLSSTDEKAISLQENDSEPTATASTQQEQIKVFDNVPLTQILTEFSAFYHVSISYQDASTQSIRLFFRWDKALSLEKNVQTLNSFDRIHIVISDHQDLIVE